MIKVIMMNTTGFVRMWTAHTDKFSEAIDEAFEKVFETKTKSPPVIIELCGKGDFSIYS